MNFKTSKPVIGMIHLSGPNEVRKALKEIEIYESEGLSGIIIENYFTRDLQILENVLKELKSNPTTMSVGVNILPNNFETSFGLARVYGAEFIQLDYVSGTYVSREGNIKLDVAKYLECTLRWGEIKVYGGVWPKYYYPVQDSNLENDIHKGMELANGIVVTGSGTGKETPLEKIKLFRTHMDTYEIEYLRRLKPLIIGAGLTTENVVEQLSLADGCIVGSTFKQYGRAEFDIERQRVREFMSEVKTIKI